MAGMKLFEDYDPEMEDVFGRTDQLKPKCISVTDEQKADPLRKPKILLQAILVAEKQPMTVKQIEARMIEEDGKVMDPKPYGFTNLDDLLQACPDYIVHRRKLDGTHVYSAKVNEANQDIVEMVQQQTDKSDAKHVRSFLATGQRAKGSYGASFRAYTGEKLKDEEKVRGTPQNFQARSELGIGKTAARVSNIADVLRKSRQEIGKPHPTIPEKLIVTLADLQKKFMDIYALPPWGKRMSEEDLYNELNKPEYANILTFWRLKEDGDIYVDEVDAPLNLTQNVEKPEISNVASQESTADLTLKTIVEVPSVRAHKNSIGARSNRDDDLNSLLGSDDSDDIFPTGPGFGGGSRSISRNSQLTHASVHSDEYSDIARRFGVTNDEDVLPVDGRVSSVGLSVSLQSSFDLGSADEDSVQCTPRKEAPPAPPAMRPVDVTFSSRNIVPKIPIQSLASFIHSRGSVPYETLPPNEKFLVDFSKDVFKVFATQPGEVKVRLVDPTIDTSTIEFTGKNLRDPIESDLRWMSESTGSYRRGRQYLKPVMFIPPRGFLLMLPETRRNEEDRIEKMHAILRHHMDVKCGELEPKKIRPGSLAVHIYRNQQEVRYFRVLILGKAQKAGDVLVLLVDLDYQWFADAKFDDLFMIPPKAGFKEYPPNVLFATLYGVQGLSEEEQFVMWQNLDDENRKRDVCAMLIGHKERLPLVDMIWRDEERHLAWLSQIAKRRGAIMQTDQYSAHLEVTAEEALPDNATPQDVIDFIDYSAPKIEDVVVEDVKKEEESSEESEPSPSPAPIAHPFSVQTLDMYRLFEKATEQKNHSAIFGLVQFVRNVLPGLCELEETEELLEHMRLNAKEQLNISI